MYIHAAEFESAFRAVQCEYPKISRELAESFISKLGDMVISNRQSAVKENFGTLLRRALNDSHVWKRVDREPYKVLAGKFFGRRGGNVAKKSAAVRSAKTGVLKSRESRAKMASAPIPVKENAKGQLGWDL